jgi:hypothetical protein
MGKLKAYAHIMKVLAVSLLDEKDADDSDALELVTTIIDSTTFKKDAVHSIDFHREFVEKHNLWPGTVIKMILYGDEDAVTETDEDIEIKAKGQRIEKLVGQTWFRLSEDIG